MKMEFQSAPEKLILFCDFPYSHIQYICLALQLSGSELKPASKSILLPTHKWKIAKNGLGGWDIELSVFVAVSHSIKGMCLHVLFSSFSVLQSCFWVVLLTYSSSKGPDISHWHMLYMCIIDAHVQETEKFSLVLGSVVDVFYTLLCSECHVF